MPTLMLVTDVPFWLDRRGSSERIAEMLKYLVTFCDVTVCFIGELKVAEWNQGLKNTDVNWCGPGMPGRAIRTAAGWVDGLTKEPRSSYQVFSTDTSYLLNHFRSITLYYLDQFLKTFRTFLNKGLIGKALFDYDIH